MTVLDLIKQLTKYPLDTQVCITDWRQNLHHDSGEGSSFGMHTEFAVEMMTQDDVTDESKPFLSLSFDNEDYNEDGTRVE